MLHENTVVLYGVISMLSNNFTYIYLKEDFSFHEIRIFYLEDKIW
jgi:hypothetical protein